jgi:hypothetical protein
MPALNAEASPPAKGLKWWIIYLINEKKKKPKKLG